MSLDRCCICCNLLSLPSYLSSLASPFFFLPFLPSFLLSRALLLCFPSFPSLHPSAPLPFLSFHFLPPSLFPPTPILLVPSRFSSLCPSPPFPPPLPSQNHIKRRSLSPFLVFLNAFLPPANLTAGSTRLVSYCCAQILTHPLGAISSCNTAGMAGKRARNTATSAMV